MLPTAFSAERKEERGDAGTKKAVETIKNNQLYCERDHGEKTMKTQSKPGRGKREADVARVALPLSS
jgi:hypothetical protein